MDYIYAFITGGVLCVIATAADRLYQTDPGPYPRSLRHIGRYPDRYRRIRQKSSSSAGRGATVPLTGFGYSLATGVKTAIDEVGAFGILSGGVSAAAAGIAAVIVFGYIFALIFKPGAK